APTPPQEARSALLLHLLQEQLAPQAPPSAGILRRDDLAGRHVLDDPLDVDDAAVVRTVVWRYVLRFHQIISQNSSSITAANSGGRSTWADASLSAKSSRSSI